MRTRRSRAQIKQETIIDLNCHEEVEPVVRETGNADEELEEDEEGISWDEEEEL